MIWTQAHLDAIDKVIASGAKSISFPDGNGSIEYYGMNELLTARAQIAAALAAQSGTAQSQSLASFSKD